MCCRGGWSPARLPERIEESLNEPDPPRALRTMTDLQLDAVKLAPSGPNIDRARSWLAAALVALDDHQSPDWAPCASHAK
jgi:hypothetical protein